MRDEVPNWRQSFKVMARWLRDGELVGLPDMKYVPGPNRGLSGQRGGLFPP